MPVNIHLILHDTVGAFSAVIAIAATFFVLANNHKRTVNITLALTFLSVLAFLLSDIIGASIADPVLSREVLMWNMSVIFICMFNFHAVMAALHREKERRWLIVFVYAVSLAFVAWFIAFPDSFILAPVPKMYFPNYYVPGQLHLAFRLIFQIIIPSYFVYELIRAYRRSSDSIERNRYLYFGVAFALGWGLGIIPDLLIWNIQVDPLWGLFFPVGFIVPFTYAVLRYELIDIRIVAKRAFIYGIMVAVIGALIALFNFSSQWIQAAYPGFPFWAIPLVSSAVVVGIGVFVWKQLREDDILKYEFITTVTHKFRTPLTHIKWAAENLRKAETTEDKDEQVGYIESANAKLVELTDLLANASETDEDLYQYKLEKNDLSAFIDEIINGAMEHANAKGVIIEKEVPTGLYAMFDSARLKFVLQTLIDNAVNYTPGGGLVTVRAVEHKPVIICSVKDTGIGISKGDLQFMFTKLYRSKTARLVDTEGMGIGLYISKGILARHHGKIWADSEGENKGSTFSFSLPAAK